jgi:hypothetical protein
LLGTEILLAGFLFGWATGGFAVYANGFYWRGVFRVWRDKKVGVSNYIMLGLAATLPLFKGVIKDEASGIFLPVVSWDWGAACWLFSLVLLALAVALREGKLARRGVTAALMASIAILACVGLLQWSKWQGANAQERAVWFPRLSLLTPRSICGIPLTWPDRQLVPDEEILALDVDAALTERWPDKVDLPAISHYLRDGYRWEDYPDFQRKLRIRAAAVPARFTLQLKHEGDGPVIRILESGTAQPLYEQRLRRVLDDFNRASYCPYAEIHGRPAVPGYQSALTRALGVRAEPGPRWEEDEETADQPCDISVQKPAGGSGFNAWHEWDGREVWLDGSLDMYRWPGFCSAHYAALASVAPRNARTGDWTAMVLVFERRTLRQLGEFRDPEVCWPQDSKRCPRIPAGEIRGVRINRSQVAVDTARGTFNAGLAR